MPKYSTNELDNVYQALANGIRRKILTRLCEGECSISDLAEPFDVSMAAVSKHINVLEKAGLLTKRRDGTTVYCRARLEPVKSAAALIRYLNNFIEAQPVTQQVDDIITHLESRA